jgi:hypothetical protein
VRRTFIHNLLIGSILSLVWGAGHSGTARAATIHHYEYVFIAGWIYVYDMDNGFKLVKSVQVPTGAGMRGAVASAATGMLYLAYGSDGDSGGQQLAYNLSTDQVAWTMSYSHGIDSQSVTPDGKRIYMPGGELASGGNWYVQDSANGNDITSISTGGSGPHNTIVSPGGTRVYMGDRDFSGSAGNHDFTIADTATNQVVGEVTPLRSGARPFTINSKETLAFITATGFLGFQVADLAAGKVIYVVPVDGSKIPGFTTQTPATIPSHGITLSPNDKEVYLIDQPNSYVHVFDVSGLPASAPVQVADIKLQNQMSGNEAGCAYDCLKDGWIHHSRDGRFVFVGDAGDVIDTLTRKTIAVLPHMGESRIEIEIDFQDGTPIWAANARGSVGYVNPLPPIFTARITGPNLGSTVSGANVAVTTSVFDSATVTAVDLYKDGVLYASTTASPYTFNWDTTKDSNGSHTLTVTANDVLGNSTSFLATFKVSNVNLPNPPSITTSSLPGGTQNVAYSANLAATGGTTPYSWSVISGSLPVGLTLAPGTGGISGTPSGTGTSNFTAQVTDANSLTATKSLSITVGAAASISITTSSLPRGTQNTAYSATLAATGGTPPLNWSVIAGNLPAGLALDPSTGIISGTPTGSGTSTFTVQVSDANSLTATKSLSVLVRAAPSVSITTSSLPGGAQNTAYSASLAASGGTPPYMWSITSGALPAGLTLAPSTGVISGTPTGSGTSTFTVQVSDANSLTATKSLSIVVSALPSISIATSSFPGGRQNAAYSATLAAAGGTPPLSWSIVSGTLPAGLNLAPSSGVISGTPNGTGSSTFTVQVADANSLTATKWLTITVSALPSLSIATNSLPGGRQNTAYSATLAAAGGTPPLNWSIISGSLPAGLALTPSTGMISGTPTGAGTSAFIAQVSDANSMTATKSLSITVASLASVSITTTSLPGGTQNTSYSATLAASGGSAPYSWSIRSGTLPAGLALAPSSGAISGTPTGTGTSNFRVRVTDANSLTASRSLSITVGGAPSISISTSSLPGGAQNMVYSTTLVATGGTPPLSWSIISGTLPVGLALAPAAGVISGTPSGSGTSNFTVRVTDANSLTASKSLSITVSVAPSISITTTSLPGGTQNTLYSATLAATGGTLPYDWSVISGNLPAGLTIAPSTGIISGTPTGTGTSNFTVRVMDTNSLTATKSFGVTVSASTSTNSIAVISGTSQSAIVGAAFGSTLKAAVKDSHGNPLPGLTVTFTAPAQTGPSGTFAGGVNTATTDANGVATSPAFSANSNVGGPYSVTAAVTGAPTFATFSLTNVDFTIAPSDSGAVSVTAGSPANVALLLTTTPASSNLPADVSFSCAPQAPQTNTVCTVTPAKFSAGTVSGSAMMLTISSTAKLSSAPRRQLPHIPNLPWALSSAFASLIALYFAAQQRIAPTRRLQVSLTLVLLSVTVTGLVGCVGLTSASPHGQNGTPSSVIVTAASQGVSKTATVNISLK